MSYDPTQAGDPIPRKFKNVLKCVKNEVITMDEAVEQGLYRSLPDGVDGGAPFWALVFKTLDARRTDGTPLTIPTCGRIYNKEGARQDNTQRPYRVSIAFAGLPDRISVFPGDPEGKFDGWCAANASDHEPIGSNPSYDASKVVNRVFLCEMEKMEIGRDMPIPLVAYEEGYLYTGKVREVRPREGAVNEDGTAAPASNTLIDIAKPGGEEELAKVLGLITGQATDAEFFDLIRAGGVDNRTLLDGESVLGVAVNGDALVEKLTALGHIQITDGRIAAA